MNPADAEYLDLLRLLLTQGELRPNRTGTPARSYFGARMTFDLSRGFPLLTTKRLHRKSIVLELLWMLGGHTNNDWLTERGVTIWSEWAREDGDLGPIYGRQWRSWHDGRGGGTDQIARLVDAIQKDPYSRRHLVSAWKVDELPQMALPPCHVMFQFYVTGAGRLSCQLYQRSADAFLGLPFNIASYALLTCMLAHATGYLPGEFIHVIGDAHLYENHVEQAYRQLQRTPRPAPRLTLRGPFGTLDGWKPEHIQFTGYESWPALPAEVAK